MIIITKVEYIAMRSTQTEEFQCPYHSKSYEVSVKGEK